MKGIREEGRRNEGNGGRNKESEMGIMTRLVRLCKADIHGVMDQMEDKGLLLKQHLRDMREELDKKESRLAGMLASREETQRERETRSREHEALERDLALAIAQEKDDIARTLIRKVKSLVHHGDELDRHIQALDTDISRYRAALEEQRRLYEQFQLKASEHLRRSERQQWKEAMRETLPLCCLGAEPAEAEVELELLRRKEALKRGSQR
jgi:phage shock protein A